MKTLVTLALLMLVGSAIVGCKASAEVDPDNATHGHAPFRDVASAAFMMREYSRHLASSAASCFRPAGVRR